MGLLDFLTRFQSSYKHANAVQDFKTEHPEFQSVDDSKLAGALAKKYPDKYSFLSNFHPDASVPPDLVPNEKRTAAFYEKNPTVSPQKTGVDIISQVKTKYPEFADVPDEKLAKALETKFPDRFPKLTELVVNDKFGSITADTTAAKPKSPVQEAIHFLAEKTGLDVYAPNPQADAQATMALSQMTGLEPAKIQAMDGGTKRQLFEKATDINTQPTNLEFTQGMLGMSAMLFGAQTPAALFKGVVTLQGLHTAISQAIRAYKGEAVVDPAKRAALMAHWHQYLSTG